MAIDCHRIPVVQSGAAHCTIVHSESGDTDDVQRHLNGSAQPRDVACVLRNLWFDKNNLKHDACGLDKTIRNDALYKSIAVPFSMAFKASEDVRHLNVVVVSCVNELSLLCGLLGRFFLAALFRGLLLSCHIVVSPS